VGVMPAQTALEPAVRTLGGAGGVVAGDVKRRALVEYERDVRSQRRLHLHRCLGTDEPLVAVEIGAKADALLLDRENRALAPVRATNPPLDLVRHPAVTHREHLKAAGVSDDRSRPA